MTISAVDDVLLRLATPDDAAAIAEVFLASFKAAYEFPLAHTDDQVHRWIGEYLVPNREVWVAVAPGGAVVGLMALSADQLDQLYLAPGWTKRGIGSRLVELAKERRPDGLDLFTFQVNANARRFYEQHGFVQTWTGDGSDNDEGQPDVRYAWRPEPAPTPEPSLPAQLDANPALTPFLKWPGGKTHELAAIAAAAPELTGRFIDPFVGGGAVLFATPTEVPALANDACRDLVELYTSAANGDKAFSRAVDGLAAAWDGLAELDPFYAELGAAFTRARPVAIGAALADHAPTLRRLLDGAGPGLTPSFDGRAMGEITTKLARMRRLEIRHGQRLNPADLLANVEGAVRSSMYMSVRARYNAARRADRWDAIRAADFLFLREFTYAAMFRFNARDEFNVPYGGISYNRKSLADKARLLLGSAMLARLANTRFESRDFEPFLAAVELTSDDFVFVDPPYDSDFSAYDNRPFGSQDQVRLERILAALPARVMVVIKDAPAIRALYGSDRWNVVEAPKTYMWTIKSRNDRLATHLTITNYQLDGA